MTLRVSDWLRVTWTAFAILAMFSRPPKNENSLERVCRLDLTSFSAPQAPQRGSQGWNKIAPIAFSFFTTPLHNTTTTNTGSLLMLKNISNRFRLLDSVYFLPHKIYDISQNKSAKKKLSIHFQVLSLQEDQTSQDHQRSILFKKYICEEKRDSLN